MTTLPAATESWFWMVTPVAPRSCRPLDPSPTIPPAEATVMEPAEATMPSWISSWPLPVFVQSAFKITLPACAVSTPFRSIPVEASTSTVATAVMEPVAPTRSAIEPVRDSILVAPVEVNVIALAASMETPEGAITEAAPIDIELVADISTAPAKVAEGPSRKAVAPVP